MSATGARRVVFYAGWLVPAVLVALPSPARGDTAAAVAANTFHSCALTTSGGVKCWGQNYDGMLGDGTTTDRITPVAVSGLGSGVAAVAVGGFHTCAVTTAGGLECWGSNDYGQLGTGPGASHTPTDVIGLTSGVAAVAGGYAHTCALTTPGGVKCWGGNYFGNLGDGTNTDRPTPVDVIGLGSGVAAITAGEFHSCALTTAGGVKCWGSYDGSDVSSTPVDVSGLTSGVAAIAAGDFHTCVLTTAGGVQCWGQNVNGELGDGTTTGRPTPADVSGLTSGVIAIAAAAEHSCAVTVTGGAKCWGSNARGGIGDGTTTMRLIPTDVIGLASGVATIAAGSWLTCASTLTGEVECWGFNHHGQLGNGTIGGSTLTAAYVVGFGQPCGDGVTEGAEECDDGNRMAGDCCSPTCQWETAGSPCDDGNVCTDDTVCDGVGGCQSTPNSASCDDGIFCNGVDTCAGGICTHAGDPCAGGGECANFCFESAETCNRGVNSPCTDDGSPCTRDVCNGSGACIHPIASTGTPCRAASGDCDLAETCDGTTATCPADSGLPDSDHDGECDGRDPCTGGQTFTTPPRAKLTLRRINSEATPGNDRLTVTGFFSLPAGKVFADLRPDLRGGRLVIEAQDGARRVDVSLAAGAYAGGGTRGWRVSSGKRWTFVDRTGSPANGVTKMRIVNRDLPTMPQRIQVMLTGRNGTYPLVDGDEPARAIVTLGDQTDAAQGLCGETAFDAADCAFDAGRSNLTCQR